MTATPERCTRCNEVLKPARITWLEFSQTDSHYYKAIPADHVSQGAFPFGADCAKAQLKETLKHFKQTQK